MKTNSNLEASKIEVCQICLATDVKMFSLRGGILNVCLKSILGLNDNHNMEGLPQFVCFECSAVLFKCHKLIEKSKIAQETLFDIFTENGQITKYLVKKKDREQLGIHSTLVSPESFPIFEYEYNEEDSITYSKTRDYYKLKADTRKFSTLKISMDKTDEDDAETKTKSQFELDEIISAGDEISENYFIEDHVDSFDFKEYSPVSESNEEDVLQNADVKYFEDQELSDDITIKDEPLVRHKQLKDEIKDGKPNKSEVHGNSEINITAEMTKYYKLVRLGLQKQIDEFKRQVHKTLSLRTNFQCDVCRKKFETKLMLTRHVFCHDPLRGPVVCPVCKFRFKDKKRANKHSILHSKRYHCKLCPKIMLSWTSAKKHLGRHLGVRYPCPDCAFTTAVQSDLPLHRRRHHATAAHCAYCGKGFIGEFGLNMHVNLVHARASRAPKPKKVFTCEECDVDFHSEGARLLHMLNSKTHKIKNQNKSNHSKSAYATRSSTVFKRSGNAPAIEKRKDERIKPLLKFYRKPASARDYPKQCDLCDTVLETRADHYAHVRRAHPAQRGAWQPIITVYCDTCGHGYATKAALRRHVLRHNSPTVKCSHCPRYFHDKYSMAAHAILHAEEEDKPHLCSLCGKGFAHRSKLAKHMVVHTSDRPHSCSVCRKTFKCTNSLSRHMRKVHLRMHSKSAEKTRKTKKTD